MHFIDESSIVTLEIKNQTYLLKIQSYSRTDYFQLTSRHHETYNNRKQNTTCRTIGKLDWARLGKG